MTMKNPQTCLSAELQRQLSHDELSPAELKDVEDHVSDCERCRQLLEVPQFDPQWQDEIVPILRTPLGPPLVTGDHDERGTEGESLESILRLLGPTDDPHMLGRIGSYEVVGVIGRGGMGVVFKAYEGALNRFVAIKMLLPHLAASGAARKRFAREGKAAAAVIDDNVMPIYSVAEWQGVPYLVTQYSRGATLQKRIQDQGPQELKEILRIGMQTARGLAAAHAQGLVHRDVKPSNILLDGTVERALLTDFGLARAVDDASITRTGIIAGTPQYMSPEQARGGNVDARADLFSLGCVLYFLCTGHPPFRADNSYAVLRLITDEEPRSIREIIPEIPEWMCVIVGKLMAKKAAERYGSTMEVAKLLEIALAHVQQPTTVPLPESLRAKSDCPANLSSYQRKVPAVLFLAIIITTASFLMMPDERPLIPLPASEPKPNVASVADTSGQPELESPKQLESRVLDDSGVVTELEGDWHLVAYIDKWRTERRPRNLTIRANQLSGTLWTGESHSSSVVIDANAKTIDFGTCNVKGGMPHEVCTERGTYELSGDQLTIHSEYKVMDSVTGALTGEGQHTNIWKRGLCEIRDYDDRNPGNGMGLFYLNGDDENTGQGKLIPGDKVDVLVLFNSLNETPVQRVLIERLEVNQSSKGTANSQRQIGLLGTDEQCLLLTNPPKNGTMSLRFRRADDGVLRYPDGINREAFKELEDADPNRSEIEGDWHLVSVMDENGKPLDTQPENISFQKDKYTRDYPGGQNHCRVEIDPHLNHIGYFEQGDDRMFSPDNYLLEGDQLTIFNESRKTVYRRGSVPLPPVSEEQ